LSKHKLLDELFTLSGNHEIDKIESMKTKLSQYIEANGDDVQIRDGLRMLEAHLVENKSNDLNISREIVSPMFDRLANADY